MPTMLAVAVSAAAQTATTPSSADYLKAYAPTDCSIPFDVRAEGKAFPVKWGMDTSWDWDYPHRQGELRHWSL